MDREVGGGAFLGTTGLEVARPELTAPLPVPHASSGILQGLGVFCEPPAQGLWSWGERCPRPSPGLWWVSGVHISAPGWGEGLGLAPLVWPPGLRGPGAAALGFGTCFWPRSPLFINLAFSQKKV